jgi:hypothetical protein
MKSRFRHGCKDIGLAIGPDEISSNSIVSATLVHGSKRPQTIARRFFSAYRWDMTGIVHNYLIELRQNGFPLPSDFSNEPTYEGWTVEDETEVAKEFEQFFRQWRERVLQALERRKESA